jgi:hypothetical protein
VLGVAAAALVEKVIEARSKLTNLGVTAAVPIWWQLCRRIRLLPGCDLIHFNSRRSFLAQRPRSLLACAMVLPAFLLELVPAGEELKRCACAHCTDSCGRC